MFKAAEEDDDADYEPGALGDEIDGPDEGSESDKEKESPGRYKCNLCLKTFKFPCQLKAHGKCRGKPKERTLECDKCSHKSRNAEAFKKHMLRHKTEDENGSFLCKFCKPPRNFKTQKALQHHWEEEHYKNLGTRCTYCNLEVKHPGRLLRHIRVMHETVYQVWSLTQLCSVDSLKSRIGVEKVSFQQTHNQGLRELVLTVSWDLRA